MFGACVFVGVRTELNANVMDGGGVVGGCRNHPHLNFLLSLSLSLCLRAWWTSGTTGPGCSMKPTCQTASSVHRLTSILPLCLLWLCVPCKAAWSLVVTWCSQGRGKSHYISRDLLGVLTPSHSVVSASPRDHVHPSTPLSIPTAL